MLTDRRNLGAQMLTGLGVTVEVVRKRLGYPARRRDLSSEITSDVIALRKENEALRAAITEMRPFFDRAVRSAASGGAEDRSRASEVLARVAAGEFGEPRHLLE